jgi:hypothetical protein
VVQLKNPVRIMEQLKNQVATMVQLTNTNLRVTSSGSEVD